MNLVDSCGWLEYFADGRNAYFFAEAIENTEELIVPTICITEVFKRILQQRNDNFALQAVALMRQGKIVDLNNHIAVHAAKWGHELKLPLVDSIIYATAGIYNAIIYTEDADFRDLERVRYIERK